jgi:hypothetical protein
VYCFYTVQSYLMMGQSVEVIRLVWSVGELAFDAPA